MNEATAGSPDRPSLPPLVAAELQDHLMIASCDLDRLQTLLADACATLMQRFHDATQQISGLRDAPAAQRVADAPLDTVMRQLHGAVVALQFQDMASQLICHTHRRLRTCADQLAREAFGDDEDGPTLVEPAPLRPNPVTQSEMDAGSVELF